ncbi:radical SAM/SPASM domain-containing protein [Bifidobacterium vespertilionis]|uniref:radical SAM/SPASM domain-containing protein n=1 Tax=Bifidobacterium vespertilionis TaxID=2562524 RepID=UPI001BDC4C8F|nr:radical SAM protein [Bifidobacterium vespertilionis]MBT1179219.1 radical SAM protein [Bifidobacterium vespertilionis]
MNQYKWSPYIEKIKIDEKKTCIYSYITNKQIIVSSNDASRGTIYLDSKKARLLIDNGFICKTEDDPYIVFMNQRDLERYSSSILDVVLHLNYDCNLACPYCYQNSLPKTITMSEQVIHNVIDNLNIMIKDHNSSKLFLTLIGGEPTLHFGIVEILFKSMKSIKIPISGEVVTNGTLLSDGYVEQCLKLGIDTFDITLDGTKETHDKLRIHRDGSGSFDEIINNILNIQNKYNDANLTINYNLSKQTAENVETFCEYLQKIGYTGQLSFSLIFEPPESDYKGAFQNHDNIWRIANSTAAKYNFNNAPFYRTPHLFCPMYNKSSYFIDPQGFIWSCINGIGKSHYYQGPINSQNDWHQMTIRARRLETLNTPRQICKYCKFLPVCTGCCSYLNEEKHFHCLRGLYQNNEVPLLKKQILESITEQRKRGQDA